MNKYTRVLLCADIIAFYEKGNSSSNFRTFKIILKNFSRSCINILAVLLQVDIREKFDLRNTIVQYYIITHARYIYILILERVAVARVNGKTEIFA